MLVLFVNNDDLFQNLSTLVLIFVQGSSKNHTIQTLFKFSWYL